MNIGFDAKRAYQNATGLGHYSRTLISSLATYFPQNEYFLFAPKITNRFATDIFKNVHTIHPKKLPESILKNTWRGNWVKKDLLKNNINIYHGLSHQIPIGINKTNVKSVVTIHDLIFERYPKQYNSFDVAIYRKKFTYACNTANKIIAISQQTKNDIVDFYKINADKIDICYQSCNDAFRNIVTEDEKKRIAQLYQLPKQFFLYVGSVIERKNLLTIVKAINSLKDNLRIPLVVIGDGSGYKQQVQSYIATNNLQQQVIFLSDNPAIKALPTYQSAKDFPAIYQQAIAMLYPSTFEGFGIPVLEALCSRLPVITSNISCLPEAGGNAAYYVNPFSADEIATAMQKIYTDKHLATDMITKGTLHAANFTQQKTAGAVMEVYKTLC